MTKLVLLGLITVAQLVGATMASRLSAETASFETDALGGPPRGWLVTMTGRGAPKWTVERDEAGGTVLRQSGKATYPLALKEASNIRDGFAEVKFKPISGSEDRAGGIVWRAMDANNYYVVRANALEDNVVLYKTVNGVRSSLDLVGQKGGYGAKTAVPANQWHTLRVEFSGTRFNVVFNGKPLFAVEDATFAEAGMVGLWTKADSVTHFNDFTYGEQR
jgi:3-keto-disaccharide hydrolase